MLKRQKRFGPLESDAEPNKAVRVNTALHQTVQLACQLSKPCDGARTIGQDKGQAWNNFVGAKLKKIQKEEYITFNTVA